MNSVSKYKTPIVVFYICALLAQTLTILKVIPYKWVNGGMSTSYRAQAMQSAVSIIIFSVIYLFALRPLLGPGKVLTKNRRLSLYFLIAFWSLGFILQIIGTNFERYFLSLLLLYGLVVHAKLLKYFQEKR